MTSLDSGPGSGDKSERVRSGDSETPEYIDQSCWIPQGEEVIPAMQLVNGHAASIGRHYAVTESPSIDRLLVSGLIDGSHHHTALKLLQLFKLGTSKQDYAVMQIFMPSRGHDNSDFCPISIFIKVTRSLKLVHMFWIRAICGLERTTYAGLAQNADLLRDALTNVEDNFSAYEEEVKSREEAVQRGKEYAPE